ALLWTHFGASGPAPMNASRHWLRAQTEGRTAALTASFCPGETLDAIDRRLVATADDAPRVSVGTLLSQFVPASVAVAMLRRLSIDADRRAAHLPRAERREIARALVEWPLPVVGTRGYNFAEATAGGVSLGEVDASSMESRVCRNLFLVGEVLD